MKSKLSPFASLKFRDFRLLWLGLLISRIGSEMQVVGLNWQVYLLTNSALSLGIIGLCRFIPALILSLPAGIAADTLDRKRVMLWSQIIQLVISILFTLVTFTGYAHPLVLYLLLIVYSSASLFDTPSRQSVVPALVPKKYFINAVSLNTILWQGAMVVGPAIAGFMIAGMGVVSVYFVNALSFLGVIISLLLIKANLTVENKTAFSLASIKEGIHFVVKKSIISSTMFLDFFATLFASATVLLPIYAKDILQVGPIGLGILYASSSIGAVISGLIISMIGHVKNQGKTLLVAVAIYGLATILFGISRSFYLSMFFLLIAGASDAVSTIIRNTIRQINTPDYIRGRMVSVNMIFFMGGPQLGETEAGILAAMWGAPLSVVIGGFGTIMTVAVISLLVPKLRKYRGDEVGIS